MYNGRLYSYFDGSRIVLARNERKVFVVIHELVHAMGKDYHDEKFIDRYFDLLVSYHKKLPIPSLLSLAASHLTSAKKRKRLIRR